MVHGYGQASHHLADGTGRVERGEDAVLQRERGEVWGGKKGGQCARRSIDKVTSPNVLGAGSRRIVKLGGLLLHLPCVRLFIPSSMQT